MTKSCYLKDCFYGPTKREALMRLEQRIGHFFDFRRVVGDHIPSDYSKYQYAFVAQKYRKKVKIGATGDRIVVQNPFWTVKLYKIPKQEIKFFHQGARTFRLKHKE